MNTSLGRRGKFQRTGAAAVTLAAATVVALGGFAMVETPGLASATPLKPMTDAWPCDGSNIDVFRAFQLANPGRHFTCYANPGSSSVKAYQVYQWDSGNNSGHFDYECHGSYYSKSFSKYQSEDLGDNCTIYGMYLD
jgi:hypothetical protein